MTDAGPDSTADALFADRVLPALGAFGDPARQPRFIVVGGQQGAGKSSLALPELAGETIQRINVDAIDALVPDAVLTNADGTRRFRDEMIDQSTAWTWQLMKRAIKSRFHVLFELTSARIAKPFLELARHQGYTTELVMLALNGHLTLASMLDRHRRDPSLLLIRERDHARSCAGWPAYLIEAENRGYYDRIRLIDRQHRQFYANHLVLRDGAPDWHRRPYAFESLLLQRNNGLTEAEAAWLEQTWSALADYPGPYRKAFRTAAGFADTRDAALAWLRSPLGRFDHTTLEPRSALTQWLALITSDLETVRTATPRFDAPNYPQLATRLLTTLNKRIMPAS